MITITKNAIRHIKDFLGKESLKDKSIRIWIENGGCAGQTYRFGVDKQRKHDRKFFLEGISFLVDKASYRRIDGTEIDYRQGFLSGAFNFHNPKAKLICGCGMSFSG